MPGKYIDGGCTPKMTLFIEMDDNPNGLPVLWMHVHSRGTVTLASVPMNKKAVGELLVELSSRIGEM